MTSNRAVLAKQDELSTAAQSAPPPATAAQSEDAAIFSMNDPIFRLNAGLFYAAHMFVSDEYTRYYLQGVYVEPHPEQGVTLTATDGKMLVSVYDRDGFAARPAILTLDRPGLARIKPCRGRNGNGGDILVVRAAEHLPTWSLAAEIRDKDSDIKSLMLMREIDGTFPDYRRAVPTYAPDRKSPGGIGCYPYQLHALADAGALMAIAVDTVRPEPAIGITLGDSAASPMMITFGPAHTAFAIVMPVNVDCRTTTPHWFVPTLSDAAPAPAPAESQVAA